MIIARSTLFLLTLFACCYAAANEVNISNLQGQVERAKQNVSALGTDLLGDRVNLFNGALEFVHTDASLPGNFGLPVEIVRKHVAGRHMQIKGAFGDWDLEVPRIYGVFSVYTGWVNTDNNVNRCSNYSAPPYVMRTTYIPPPNWAERKPNAPGSTSNQNPVSQLPNRGQVKPLGAIPPFTWATYYPEEYWGGTFLSIPGSGSKEVLKRNAADTFKPNSSLSYPLIAMGGWQIRCLDKVRNSSGEGFEALSPDGVTYTFDWMAQRTMPLVKSDGTSMGRQEMMLMATEAKDRFGNYVRYYYDQASPSRLARIESSDNRVITIAYNTEGFIHEINDGSGRWQYSYTGGDALSKGSLAVVTRPDQSTWKFSLRSLWSSNVADLGEGGTCDLPGAFDGPPRTGTVTHPSGATGTFQLEYRLHARAAVTKYCINKTGRPGAPQYARWPKVTASQTITKKDIAGPNISKMSWTYSHSGGLGTWAPCTDCQDRKTVEIKNPDGTLLRQTYGVRFNVDEGQLLEEETIDKNGISLRKQVNRYAQAGLEPAGHSINTAGDYLSSRNRPMYKRQIIQQGTTFEREVSSYDNQARERYVTSRSYNSTATLNSKSETFTYHDNREIWVVGQLDRVTDIGSGFIVRGWDYETDTALPKTAYRFGEAYETYGWCKADCAKGTLIDRTTRGGSVTRFADYYRGVPRRVVRADGTEEYATVENRGLITSYTSPGGSTTVYDYDGLGRLKYIQHPLESGQKVYHDTFRTFTQSNADLYGLTKGHWQQKEDRGNLRILRLYDELWRERLSIEEDASNPENTRKVVETRYDVGGKKSFESYPSRSIDTNSSGLQGQRWMYDGLGRTIRHEQDSELGVLTTHTNYPSDSFVKEVINPRSKTSKYWFQNFDTPEESTISAISLPESVSVSIYRDTFGKPLNITRAGYDKDNNYVSVSRTYEYDGWARLCKTVEPEVGATVQAYDANGNIAVKATGVSAASVNCDLGTWPESRKTHFSHDAMGRLKSTWFSDGSPSIDREYTSDGELKSLTSDGSNWTYEYFNTGALRRESLAIEGQTLSLQWAVDEYGRHRGLTYPDGLYVANDPDARGFPTKAGSFATQVIHHPNGLVSAFSYGNGIAHTVAQNTRGLPYLMQDQGVAKELYSYDETGNVSSIQDQIGQTPTRLLGYDGLDRLVSASGLWGTGRYDYDPVDNIVFSAVGSRVLNHNIDRSKNLLSGMAGSQNIPIGYDLNGNVVSRAGQSFSFDLGNRMRSAPGKATYNYDGHGRRTIVASQQTPERTIYLYSSTGRLLYSRSSTQGAVRYIYLGGRLVAESKGASPSDIAYVHTDALGSPVARTLTNSTLQGQRTHYEAYGATAAGPTPRVVGFTGHVSDADTGLVYMQQRYYDPIAGRFLSVDPIGTDDKTGKEFGRYTYVDNNPYAKIDPDGRIGVPGFFVGAGIDLGVQVISNMASGQSFGNALSNVSVGQALASGALGALGQIGASAAARSVVSGLSNGAKGTLGEATARVGIAMRGEKVIASQTAAGKVPELGNITGRAAKAIPDFVVKSADGSVKVVEAKFGTSGLTGAQRALKNTMGEAFTVSRTTADEVANAAGRVGAVAGGSTGATIGQHRKD